VSEILILARVRIHEYDLSIIADYYFAVNERLSTVEGSYGLSVWRDPQDSESFLVVYEYADVEAAERGLVAVTEVRSLAETQFADFRPANVLRVRTHERSGRRVSKTANTACLSMSVRVADPGYGPELVDQLGRILDELQYIPGFVGYVYGQNDILDEEVIGIVTWSNALSFQSSLPPGQASRAIEFFTRFF